MSKAIWDGRGDLDGMVYWTKDNGEFVGRPYLRRRVSSALSGWRSLYSIERRRAAIRATVDNDGWARFRNGQTVGSVVRDVEDYLMDHGQ